MDRARVTAAVGGSMHAVVTRVPAVRAHRSPRARALSLLGPATVAGGVLWGLVQPYRLTCLHPSAHGFWDLAVEAPLLVVAVGILFAVVVARPLVADLEEAERAAAR